MHDRTIKCPLCGIENVKDFYTDDIGREVEYYYMCKHCGYFEEMCYCSPVKGKIVIKEN